MRVLFCGSGAFAVPSLEAVVAAGHQVAGVVSQPARPAGRGGDLHPTPLADKAGQLGLDCQQVPDINAPDTVAWIADRRPEAICVVDFGQMVRSPVRQQARLDTFNLHGSLLPELRGAAPVNWALIRGYVRTGVTSFSLVDKMDAGPIYLQAALDIRPDETAEELRGRLAELGAAVVCRTLERLAGGQAQPTPQDDSRASLAPRLKKTDGAIDWSAEAISIVNRIRGTWPWPGAQAAFRRPDGAATPVIIARARPEPGPAAPAEARTSCLARPGEAGRLDQDLCVMTGSGRVRILQLKPAGRRLMDWRDFVNGYRVQPGGQFVSIA